MRRVPPLRLHHAALDRLRGTGLGITAGLIGWFILVEFVSGIIQGYYVPLFSDIVIDLGIHDSDVNWFEAAQLLLSAIVVPILAKLGDMYGHKRILLISSILTAAASWWLVFAGDFWTFLIAWALQGFYVVWLPLEVALIFERGRRQNRGVSSTRRAAGLLVVGLLGVRIALHQHLDPQRAQAIFAVLWCAVVLLMLVCECVRASRGLVAWTEAHSIGIVWGSGARAHTNRDPTRKFNH